MRLGVAELMVWLMLEYELLCFIDDFIRYIVNTLILELTYINFIIYLFIESGEEAEDERLYSLEAKLGCIPLATPG